MDISTAVRVVIACIAFFLFVYGACGLVALWQFPSIARSSLYGRFLTGRLPPTDANRLLLMVHGVLGGLFFALMLANHQLLAAMLVLPYTMVSIALIRAGKQAKQV